MKNGFSLNEILLTIVIISIMMVVGIPAFRNFAKYQTIVNSAKDIQNAILETQSLALAPRSASTADHLKSYAIKFSQNNPSYQIYEMREDNTGTNIAVNNNGPVKNYQLATGMQILSLVNFNNNISYSDVLVNFDISQRGLISFYQRQPEGAQIVGETMTVDGVVYARAENINYLEIKVANSQIPDRTSKVNVWAETGMMEVK